MMRVVAAGLESGRWDGAVSRALSSTWGLVASRRLVRPLVVPSNIDVVCVGGATLGGSGKTRVAIACARELAAAGARVVVVGHAYRARPRRARVVTTDDVLAEVGDEALVCARILATNGARAQVVVAPRRQSAIDHAALLSPDVLVLDGPLRIRGGGRRVLSLLALDATRPWGSARLPPAGDLRATREALVACADHVVSVDAVPTHVSWTPGIPRPASTLRDASIDLFTAIARPDRLTTALRSIGVRVERVLSVPDHGPVSAAIRRLLCDAPGAAGGWLATEKCAIHLAGLKLSGPLATLRSDVTLPAAVRAALGDLKHAN